MAVNYRPVAQGLQDIRMLMNARRLATALFAGACALQAASSGGQTPEQEKIWEAQRAQTAAEDKIKAERLARERQARKADPMAWVRTLNPMSDGGWQFRSVAPDGSWANFS